MILDSLVFLILFVAHWKRISQQEEQQPGRGKAKGERERERGKRGCVIYYYNYIFSMCGFYNLYLYAKEYLKIRRYEVYGKTVTQDLFNVLVRSSPVLALWRPLVVAYLCYLSYYLKMASLFPSWLPVNLHLLKYLHHSRLPTCAPLDGVFSHVSWAANLIFQTRTFGKIIFTITAFTFSICAIYRLHWY